MSPLRAGFVYGSVAAAVALVTDLRFLFIDPEVIPDWILTVFEGFRTQLALALRGSLASFGYDPG